MCFPCLKSIKLGKPLISYLFFATVFSVASHLAKILDWPLMAIRVAAFSYFGASALQWPHHGAARAYATHAAKQTVARQRQICAPSAVRC